MVQPMMHLNGYKSDQTWREVQEFLLITSGENNLAGYLYGLENDKGLIVISSGHRDASDIKLYEVLYFVDQGWSVLCFDYTGCYGSQGKNMVIYGA